MYRFFVEKKINNFFELSQDVLNHLKSIRIKKEEKFYCIYKGEYYICYLENKSAIIIKKINIDNEYKNELTLYASIINIKRFEWLIQKATELGVKDFYPMITKNTNVNFVSQVKKKITRFQEISKNAAEQSFRNFPMNIHDPIDFYYAISSTISNKYIAHEKLEIDDQIENNNIFDGDLAFFVGPEGGFDEEEIKIAKQKNIKTISLGKRILRSETASIFLLSRVKN